MALALNRLIDPVQVTNALVTYYTSPVNQYTLIKKGLAVNTDTAARTFTLEIIKSGGTAGAASIVLNAVTIAPGQTRELFEVENQILNPGDFIQAMADTGAKVSFSLSGVVVTQ